jgi:hypothetical protein
MTADSISAVSETSFAASGVRERSDLQRLLKRNIEVVAPGTLLIAEEFGSWDASYRRIDLLGVSKDAKLVVIELKRDDTGVHMELQALRYAAMVARMTFDQAVNSFQSLLRSEGSEDDARVHLLRFLGWEEPDESAFAQDVSIILVAADFSRELTTSVMWLNERDLDIRCVQVKPYQLGDQLLLSVDQVLPLREASDYQVQVREKARRERASATSNADWTRYDLTLDGSTHPRLYKRRLILAAVRHAIERLGKTPEEIAAVVRHSRLWASADGTLDEAQLQTALEAQGLDPRRYFSEQSELVLSNGRTYAFTKGWGTNTLPAMEALRSAFPELGVTYSASPEE